MPRLILFNKPYQVLSQFTDREAGRATLKDFMDLPKVRPAGRLDYVSEGLLVLTDDGSLQNLIANPHHKLAKTYWVQVEGSPNDEALKALRSGITLNDGPTLPALAERRDEPLMLWPRDPPIRFRQEIPTEWISLTIQEGRNRQIRRMTAAVGFPTLRLIRAAIGPWSLDGLAPGTFREVDSGSWLMALKNSKSPLKAKSRRP